MGCVLATARRARRDRRGRIYVPAQEGGDSRGLRGAKPGHQVVARPSLIDVVATGRDVIEGVGIAGRPVSGIQ